MTRPTEPLWKSILGGIFMIIDCGAVFMLLAIADAWMNGGPK